MGKAMSQVSEEIAAFSDDDSIGAQSHALVGFIKNDLSSYAFTTGPAKMREFLLLNNQSSVHVFCNQDYVKNIRAAGRELSLKGNGGTLPIKNIADYNGFEELVGFSENAMTNILSLARARQEYQVSYNGDDFIIHHAKHGYTDIVFRPETEKS